MGHIVEFFTLGGPFMYGILGVWVVALAIILERVFVVFFRYNINGSAFMAQIQKLVAANNIDRAIKLCNAEPHAALSKVLKAGLVRANRSAKEITDSVDEATLEVLPQVTRRTPMLGMWANVATLTGLLGTISGLIQAFKAVSAVTAEQKQALLASGISVAMYTTEFGLIVAIPIMIFHSILQSGTTRMMDDIDVYSVKLVHQLEARGEARAVERRAEAKRQS
jgi:biopolymer transport protein ExbB